ncbi:hypothetical protein EDD70_2812 [Hydrogenoanaerobacterium saccharovorans]|uniref:Uncharacterized protein n=1 Tax=Hydrogenoanaerobacterium saccharovorans TaxID=474960 RepID=A0A1H8DZU1_9FIRM|nr:hypothetical protein [Hydrogenoanaerobacterium saccharovorans]RPF42070.1 hypothetical protein EDD70_2812 [Hydrogenoanaerobacterium saccharovorans]SEN12839.1 hypothetical protein SAMN05216180_2828 [Hydrogenoanaerobacterium saccharovorans]
MNKNKTATIKSAPEIGSLASRLNLKNQSYVLNTINALLFSQQLKQEEYYHKEQL